MEVSSVNFNQFRKVLEKYRPNVSVDYLQVTFTHLQTAVYYVDRAYKHISSTYTTAKGNFWDTPALPFDTPKTDEEDAIMSINLIIQLISNVFRYTKILDDNFSHLIDDVLFDQKLKNNNSKFTPKDLNGELKQHPEYSELNGVISKYHRNTILQYAHDFENFSKHEEIPPITHRAVIRLKTGIESYHLFEIDSFYHYEKKNAISQIQETWNVAIDYIKEVLDAIAKKLEEGGDDDGN